MYCRNFTYRFNFTHQILTAFSPLCVVKFWLINHFFYYIPCTLLCYGTAFFSEINQFSGNLFDPMQEIRRMHFSKLFKGESSPRTWRMEMEWATKSQKWWKGVISQVVTKVVPRNVEEILRIRRCDSKRISLCLITLSPNLDYLSSFLVLFSRIAWNIF